MMQNVNETNSGKLDIGWLNVQKGTYTLLWCLLSIKCIDFLFFNCGRVQCLLIGSLPAVELWLPLLAYLKKELNSGRLQQWSFWFQNALCISGERECLLAWCIRILTDKKNQNQDFTVLLKKHFIAAFFFACMLINLSFRGKLIFKHLNYNTVFWCGYWNDEFQ